MEVTCGPGGIGWVGGSHVWTRWYRVCGQVVCEVVAIGHKLG